MNKRSQLKLLYFPPWMSVIPLVLITENPILGLSEELLFYYTLLYFFLNFEYKISNFTDRTGKLDLTYD